MKDYTGKSPDAKIEFYAQDQVASTYDEQRFGGASGAWVSAREIELVLSLLPRFRRALDLGCGTGRLTRVLEQHGVTVGLDTSAAMLSEAQRASDRLTEARGTLDRLAEARTKHMAAYVQGDAFSLPFADASFDALVALRLMFHFADLAPLLREARRIAAPGGAIVFDTYLWSPRAWLPLDAAHWGGGVFAHSSTQIQEAALLAGLKVARRATCFLFSPYVYRRLPMAIVRGLAHLEAKLPERWRARVFWRLERIG